VKVARQLRKPSSNSQRGYILLALILAVALLAIGAAAMAPEFVFQMKRDREQEMIHRGVQYSRAIKRYYKKFGRYPTRVEELENTSNVRFLRKKFKDPVTGKDFRFLHLSDIQMLTMGGMAGGMNPAAMGAGGTGFAAGGQMGAGMAQQAAMAQASMAQAAMAMAQSGTQQNPFGGASNSGSSNFGSSNSDPNASGDSNSPGGKTGSTSFGGSDKLSGQVFGGGPIVGVASISKDETVREFNNKNHYKDWQFIYSPMMDRGGLITGPFQPLQGGIGGQQNVNGVAGQPQPGQSGFGQQQQSGFGKSGQSSFGSSSSFGSQSQQQAPAPPASVPEQ
jgi:type II secretory pathway pseudopilin PulG